jgi:hypothetical protein
MNENVRAIILLCLLILAAASAARPAFAESRAEVAAQDALKKAESDYLAKTYGAGGARLKKALKGCGANKCSVGVRAALRRDIGAMLFRKGQKGAANKSWAAALKLQPGLAMNPAYDAPDLLAAYAAAGASVRGESGGGGVPSVGFSHVPAMEQRVNTPLPVYVEGGSSDVARVVVRYKGSTMSGWKGVDLDKLGPGWGGLIPCSDVTSGTMRYYIEGANSQKAVVASSGDLEHPHTVPIEDEISGDEPSLPGMKAPAQCGAKAADCPPDFPGCGKPAAETEKSQEENEQGREKEEGKTVERRRRLWVGLAGALDFMPLPAGSDVCRLDSTSLPINSSNYYCTNGDGSDFPTRNDGGALNGALVTGKSGNVGGGVAPGNLRLMLSFDYALSKSLLLGARLGILFFGYPGSQPNLGPSGSMDAATRDGRTGGLGRIAGSPMGLHAEVRGTFVFGDDPLAHAGLAPVLFAGAGVSEFDAHTSDVVTISSGQSGTVNIWKTDGPFFLMGGAGLRWALGPRVATNVAVRGNVAGFASGLVATFGPEVGIQFGF